MLVFFDFFSLSLFLALFYTRICFALDFTLTY